MVVVDAGALLIGLVVAWVISGILTAWLALERGWNWLEGFLFGFLLGPMGLLAMGLSGRTVGRKFKACLECQEAIPRLATTCPFCATDLIAAEAEERDRLRDSQRQGIQSD